MYKFFNLKHRVLAGLLLVSSMVIMPMATAQSTDELLPETSDKITDAKAESLARAEDPQAITPPKDSIPSNLLQLGMGEAFSKYAFLADKETRTLSVWENKNGVPVFLEAHPMDIGKKSGDKTVENDHRTPEGIYFPQKILEGSQLDYENYGVRAFPLDYPNFFDRRERKTGYGIWLHAIPPTKTLVRGSRGCVVVRNEIIQKLSDYIELEKTPVIITNEVKYLKVEDFKKQNEQVQNWLENWRQAWETKNIDAYISNYGEDFRSLGMKKPVWKRFKSELNEKYESISVRIINPIVLSKGDMLYVRFLQEYVSNKKQDFGAKTLYVKKRKDQYEIIGEEWAPATAEMLAQKEKFIDKNTSAKKAL